MQLNRFIAAAGVCSRRKAEILIEEGSITVNGVVATSPGYRVQDTDIVKYKRKRLIAQDFDYILLNKPKGYVTTVEDEEGRPTVLDLVEGASSSRLFPIGRLDKETTGVLLLTNDGSLAQKLSHPKYKILKRYEVSVSRPLAEADLHTLSHGVILEDGKMKCDRVLFTEKRNQEVIVEIHSGRNRIIRRVFEHLKYWVKALDRLSYAGITKKGLARGAWRRLTQHEIDLLKKTKEL